MAQDLVDRPAVALVVAAVALVVAVSDTVSRHIRAPDAADLVESLERCRRTPWPPQAMSRCDARSEEQATDPPKRL